MSFNEVVTAIATIGFPSVMCLYLLKQNDKMRDVLEKNTIVLQKLLTALGLDKNGDGEVDE